MEPTGLIPNLEVMRINTKLLKFFLMLQLSYMKSVVEFLGLAF